MELHRPFAAVCLGLNWSEPYRGGIVWNYGNSAISWQSRANEISPARRSCCISRSLCSAGRFSSSRTELGVTLIERGGRPVRLTDGGRLVYEQAVQVLERVEATKAIGRRLQEAGRLRFSLGFVPSTLYGYLPEVIRRYRGARPGVKLTLLELTTLQQIAALKEGASTSVSVASPSMTRW